MDIQVSSTSGVLPSLRLQQGEITCGEAIKLLVNAQGEVELGLIDRDVYARFINHFKAGEAIPQVIPLLWWENCYYLGSAVFLGAKERRNLADRVGGKIQIIPIARDSYERWSNPEYSPGAENGHSTTDNPSLELSRSGEHIKDLLNLITNALNNRAKEIHLEPQVDSLRIRYRIDGLLQPITVLPPSHSRKLIVCLKAIADLEISQMGTPQTGRINNKYLEHFPQDLDVQVTTMPCISEIGGNILEQAVLHLEVNHLSVSALGELGMGSTAQKIYQGWLGQKQGLILITGPRHSGKTHTMYASLRHLGSPSLKIMTVEKMVGKILPETIQTQIHGIANLNLYQLLEAVIVQNPDIIMVEDLKEPGLAVRAIEASLEGHLVISSLDTHDTISAIPRLKKLGVTRDLMMDGLIGIINQRLVRKICPYCSEPYRPQNKELALLGLERGSLQTTGWRRGKGCIKCLDSGYLGQELIVEVLNVDDGVREMLYQDCLLKLHQHLENITYFSFRTAAIAKINSGVTTTEEIARILPLNMIGGKSRQEYQNRIAQQVTQIRASSPPRVQVPFSSDLGPLLDDFNW